MASFQETVSATQSARAELEQRKKEQIAAESQIQAAASKLQSQQVLRQTGGIAGLYQRRKVAQQIEQSRQQLAERGEQIKTYESQVSEAESAIKDVELRQAAIKEAEDAFYGKKPEIVAFSENPYTKEYYRQLQQGREDAAKDQVESLQAQGVTDPTILNKVYLEVKRNIGTISDKQLTQNIQGIVDTAPTVSKVTYSLPLVEPSSRNALFQFEPAKNQVKTISQKDFEKRGGPNLNIFYWLEKGVRNFLPAKFQEKGSEFLVQKIPFLKNREKELFSFASGLTTFSVFAPAMATGTVQAAEMQPLFKTKYEITGISQPAKNIVRTSEGATSDILVSARVLKKTPFAESPFTAKLRIQSIETENLPVRAVSSVQVQKVSTLPFFQKIGKPTEARILSIFQKTTENPVVTAKTHGLAVSKEFSGSAGIGTGRVYTKTGGSSKFIFGGSTVEIGEDTTAALSRFVKYQKTENGFRFFKKETQESLIYFKEPPKTSAQNVDVLGSPKAQQTTVQNSKVLTAEEKALIPTAAIQSVMAVSEKQSRAIMDKTLFAPAIFKTNSQAARAALKSDEKAVFRSEQRLIFSEKAEQQQKVTVIPVLSQQLKQQNKAVQKPQENVFFKEATRSASKVASALLQLQKTKQKENQKQISIAKTTAPPRSLSPLWGFSGSERKKPTREDFLRVAYKVYSRRFGKEVLVAKDLPENLAKKAGFEFVRKTLARSIWLEKSGTTTARDVNFREPSGFFRPSKKDPRISVQRNALSDISELKEIQFFKRKSAKTSKKSQRRKRFSFWG